MSGVAQDAVAAVPSDSNVEGLERRLLELRAEIDAILMQLAGQKAPAVSELAAVPALHAQEADAEPALAEASMPEAPQAQAAEPDAAVDADVQLVQAVDVDVETPDQPSATQPMPEDAPIAELPSVDEASELSSAKSAASDDLTLIAAIDANPVGEDAAISTAADAAAADAQAQGELAAVEVSAAAAPVDAVTAEETPAALPAADEGKQTHAEVPSLPVIPDIPVTTTADAEARVINFEPRSRKQKGTFVAASAAPVQRGRRIATRVAAGIVALIAAATALVVSDRTAVGSTLSLPWTSPLPSYLPSKANWPFLGQFKSSEQSRAAGDRDDAANAALAVAHEALQARYREVWPTSP